MSLKGFFREAAVQPEHIKTVISRRFLDEEGNAIAWELRPVPEPENAKIRKAAFPKSSLRVGWSQISMPHFICCGFVPQRSYSRISLMRNCKRIMA